MIRVVPLWLLVACQSGGVEVVDKSGSQDTDGVTDTPTETDSDTDSDTDPDTVPDTDTDTVPTGGTAETAVTIDTVPVHTGDTATVPVEVPPPVPDVVVDCGGAGDFTTIQGAIDASVSGTKIGVQPCTYVERIDFHGKSLDVYGLAGPATTILDGGGDGPIATFARGESYGTRLAGLTLTNGKNLAGPSAIYVDYSRVTLEDLVVTGNQRSLEAISSNGSMVTLIDTTISGNAYSAFGGTAITGDSGSMVLSRVTLDCDGADEAIFSHHTELVLDSTVTCTGGYGIFVDGGEIHARRSRIVGTGDAALHAEDNPDNLSERVTLSNVEVVGGQQGAFLQYMHVDIDQSTFVATGDALELDTCRDTSSVHDSILLGGACDLRGDGTAYDIEWNGYTNGGNCSILGSFTTGGDPLFVAPPDDLHLQVGSPMIDAGDPGDSDPDGSRADLGRYGGREKNGPP